MDEDSVSASIHMHYMMAVYKSFFHKQVSVEGGEKERLLISDNYPFIQFYQRMLIEVDEQGASSHFQKICEQAHPEYKGLNHCAYNVAKALADTHALLSESVSKNP